MANYQSITELVDQIPADTWEVLREIKQRVSTRYRCHSFRHLEMSLRSGSGGGRARSLRRSAASDRRPQRGRVQPLPVFTETASAHSARRETG